MTLTSSQVVKALQTLGWPARQAHTAAAVEDFQAGWALGEALKVDGLAGPKTQAALEQSLRRHAASQGTASEHFSFSEARCRCGGAQPGCHGVMVKRALLVQLERLRHLVGPIAPVSIYRCPAHNREAGGAKDSQHLYGSACDLKAEQVHVTTNRVKSLVAFSGIGYRKRDGLVAHVDVRHVSGHNSTGGTPQRPTIWVYA